MMLPVCIACVIFVSLLKQYAAVGPGDPIDISFDMHPHDEDMVSFYTLLVLIFVRKVAKSKFYMSAQN